MPNIPLKHLSITETLQRDIAAARKRGVRYTEIAREAGVHVATVKSLLEGVRSTNCLIAERVWLALNPANKPFIPLSHRKLGKGDA